MTVGRLSEEHDATTSKLGVTGTKQVHSGTEGRERKRIEPEQSKWITRGNGEDERWKMPQKNINGRNESQTARN